MNRRCRPRCSFSIRCKPLPRRGDRHTNRRDTRDTLAHQQLQSIEQQFVGLANTQVEEAATFFSRSDADQTSPYSYDSTQADPVSAYQGTAATRVALNPSGSTFPVSLTAQQIFDSADPTTNVFTSLNNLITALQNNDQAAAQTVQSGLSGVAQYLNNQLAF